MTCMNLFSQQVFFLLLPRHERSRSTILSLKGCLTDSNLISWPLRSGFHDSRGTRCCDLDIVRDVCPPTIPYIKIPSTLKQMVYRCWQTYQVFDGQCWSVTASGKSFHAMLRLEGLVSSVTTGAECLMLVKEMTGTCIDQVCEEQPWPCPFHIFPPFLSFPMEKNRSTTPLASHSTSRRRYPSSLRTVSFPWPRCHGPVVTGLGVFYRVLKC